MSIVMEKQPCNVTRREKCEDAKKLSLGNLVVIGAAIVAIGVFMITLQIWAPLSFESAAVLSGVGAPIFIFGLVMFGILLSSYAKGAK